MIGRPFIRSTLAFVTLATLLNFSRSQAADRAKPVDFNHEVRPILSANCFACHGPDEKQRKAKLRLDNAEDAFQVRKGRVAIKPGDPAHSEMWRRISTKDPDDLMPPPDSHKKLKPEQIATLKRWIEQGASYKGHWAFEPPVRPAVPEVQNSKLKAQSQKFAVRNAIDNFIHAKLEAKGLTPSPEAPKETLIRRVTLDLTGLPPSPAEVDEFLADKSADAYERLVERLLRSPRYGEHLARYWLDAARYGDTHGLHLDNERSMWPYRDWVVRAFNANLPFDQFTVWQLAGDLLPNATRDQQIASGFNRCNVTTSEGGAIAEEFTYRYAVDRTETMATVFMGLTAGCAVCHDHKFDPLTTKEFYSLYAFFNNAADPAMDGNALLTPPILKLPEPKDEKRLAELNEVVTVAEKKLCTAATNLDYTDPATLDPPPETKHTETVWVDDDFPIGVKAQRTEGTEPPRWITNKDGSVFSGERALQRTATDTAQDYFSGLKTPFEIPTKGKIFAYVYLDPTNLPEAVMLQFNVDGKWSNRAVWGDSGCASATCPRPASGRGWSSTQRSSDSSPARRSAASASRSTAAR
ncbi:MAG: DUF1549 domain-containing protein [Verrucomicrobia bacterium]|nr:DUF1549 domain-containing protein [Verrucomicrobiota bacterium]